MRVTLTAVLTGPYRTIGDLKEANKTGPDRSHIVATAPVINLSRVPVTPPVSVVTIPAGAAPGYYNISTSDAAGGIAGGGAVIITVR
jgi:hypothetical protein